MNAKTRVENAITYLGVDQIPCGLFGTSSEYQQGLAEAIGTSSIEELYRRLQIDIWHIAGPKYRGKTYRVNGRELNPAAALYDEYNEHPPFAEISDPAEVMAFPIPGPEDYDFEEFLRDIAVHEEFALCGSLNMALFHNYLYTCGQLNGLCYLKTDPELAKAIINRITDYWASLLDYSLILAKGKLLFAENCNDFGTQISLFVSPEDFREFFKPALKRLYDIMKKHGLYVMQHSCGSVCSIIPDFIEIGADILNPIQVSAKGMELKSLMEEYRGRLCFYGGLDTQYLLPQGPMERIRQTTREAVSYFGNAGGYILSGSQGLMEDIPYAHALAMLDPSLRKF